jgi:putative heme-binding domain-containing protein
LNVTDVEFGADGAMYFITGGRGTQSGLYRVTYELPKVRDPVVVGLAELTGAKSRTLRRKLEALHGKVDPAAVDFVWPHLNSDDRWIRYAARIALEAQPVAQWQARALAEKSSHGGIAALLALARCGGSECQAELLQALAKFPLDSLNEEQKLDKLRVISLSFIRQGKPSAALRAMGVDKLSRQYPAASPQLNRELCQLLVYLEATDVVAKTMRLLAAAPTQEEQMQYVFALRLARHGWTPEGRAAYFNWFAEAAKNYTGSHNFLDFLAHTRDDASQTLTDAERIALAPLLARQIAEPPPVAPQRAFVREWTMEELTPRLNEVSRGRSFRKGQAAFTAAQCVACHRFGHEGGAIGPDLTTAASRFSRHDMLEAILLPSKVIPDQFQNTDIIRKDGSEITGRVVAEDGRKLVVAMNPLAPEQVEILKTNLKARRVSAISPMPEGLVNILSAEELLDLLAYLESGGRTDYSAFRP